MTPSTIARLHLEDLLRSSRLSPQGRIVARFLRAGLEEDDGVMTTHAPFAEPAILLIVAPPRSGSTYLLHLMSRISHVGYLRGWHCAGTPSQAPSHRVEIRREHRRNMDRLVPALLERHPIAVTGPEELNQYSARFGLSLVHLVLFGFSPFENNFSTAAGYRSNSFCRSLQEEVFESNDAVAYYVLKCPHLHSQVSLVRALFPNAKTVSIARDIGHSLASWRALVEAVQGQVLASPGRFESAWESLFIPDVPADIIIPWRDLVDRPTSVVAQLDEVMGHGRALDLSCVEESVDLVAAVRPRQKGT